MNAIKTIGTIDEMLATFREKIVEMTAKAGAFADGGEVPDAHPVSITLLCSCPGETAGFTIHYDFIGVSVEGKGEGYGNALVTTRDLLFLAAMLDGKHKIGLDLLAAAMYQHPLLAHHVERAAALAGAEPASNARN